MFILLLIPSIVGCALFFVLQRKSDISLPKSDSQKDGAALNDRGPKALSEVKILSGTVQSVSETAIVLKTFPLDETNAVDIRTVLFQEVPILKIAPLSPEEMAAKIGERKDVESPVSGTGNVPVPQVFSPGDGEDGFLKKAPAMINDLKPGDVVTVVSDTDIRNVKEIKPKEISFVFGSQIAYPEGYQP